MIVHKHITKIIAVIMAVAVCLCLAAMVFAEELIDAMDGTGVAMEYESKLFNTDEPITVNIIMDEAEWEDMLANAIQEVYYSCDVEINGETFYRVGIRPKGNTSLTAIASDPTTDRYSLKLEFDQYVDGQTCYGLDKLVLNNNYADATNMKEALIYDMYQYLGVDASLYNYAEIYVNGEYWCVYLALEAVEDSFLLRNYGTENGALYKPDSMNMGDMGDFGDMDFGDMDFGGMNFGGMDFGDMNFEEMTPPSRDGNEKATPVQPGGDLPEDFDFGGGGFGGFSMGGDGANLNYTDDDLDSYSTIWEGEVTDTTKSDHKRVVKALKNISEGVDLETYMDVDNLLKYMAVHVFSVNEDSLSGMMAHNYYLYESDGQLNILPWDYNLAFGGMSGMGSGDSATEVANSAIDQAFSGTNFFDTLMENEEYEAKYHEYLRQLADEYIYGGGFDEFYSRTRSQIDSLVESDPTAFYSYDEYLTAVETLYELVQLRGQSIQGQIDGTIPSTEQEQRNSDALVDASHLDLSVMGSMSMGGNMRGGDSKDGQETPEESGSSESGVKGVSVNFEPSQFGGGEMPEGFDPSQFGGGEMPSDFDPSQFGDGEMPEDFDPSQFGEGQAPEDSDTSETEGDTAEDDETDSQQTRQSGSAESETEQTAEDASPSQAQAGRGGFGNGGNMPDNMPNMGFSGSATNSAVSDNLILYGICFAVMAAALVFAKVYRRRTRKR